MYRLAAAIAALAATMCASIALTRAAMAAFSRLGIYGEDVFKPGRPRIPQNAGLSFTASLALSTALLSSIGLIGWREAVASSAAVAIATLVGLIDDLVELPGYYKPAAALLAGVPIVAIGCYTPYLRIALLGGFNIPLLYPLLAVAAVSVTSNMVNMLDVINGSAVWGVMISAAAGVVSGVVLKSPEAVAVGLCILASLAGLLLYNTYPARCFLGNCGSLALGASIGVLAIVGRIEVPMVIATMPFIHNSFYFLAHAKSFIEHKRLGAEVTRLRPDGLIEDARREDAPITLLRTLASAGPISEYEALRQLAMIFLAMAAAAVASALLIRVRV
ncbi:hypothetical protein B6U99_03115 [Candidatus Geothermarchaeota archaeon ex4572_27]|nr:MAG: hypothetical protein B6U99_03115 [Candidatus Geothermarchaeota archaeon ex4572_27]